MISEGGNPFIPIDTMEQTDDKAGIIREYHHQIFRKVIVFIASVIGIILFVGLF